MVLVALTISQYMLLSPCSRLLGAMDARHMVWVYTWYGIYCKEKGGVPTRGATSSRKAERDGGLRGQRLGDGGQDGHYTRVASSTALDQSSD